jgi:lipoprotein-anchoring transpeptidase ErfK/SrfK
LPYRDAAEEVAEKFHCDVHFLGELNPGKTKTIKPGDHLKVPNIEPFDLGSVKYLQPGSGIGPPVANDLPEENPSPNNQTPPVITVKIDTKANTLGVFDADKLVAAYPVTIGSAKTASPIGDWKVQRIVKLPRFRWDEAMLKYGRRSGNFHLLPPGPNSPVGVIWIALNKKGHRNSWNERAGNDRPCHQPRLCSSRELGCGPARPKNKTRRPRLNSLTLADL